MKPNLQAFERFARVVLAVVLGWIAMYAFTNTAAQSFADTWHKAGGKFSIACLLYPLVTKSNATFMWANRATPAAQAGVTISVSVSGGLVLRRSRTTSASTTDTSTTNVVGDKRNFLCAGWDDASSLVRMQINSTHESQAGLQSTDSDAPAGTPHIGADGSGTVAWDAAERFAGIAMFNRLLTESEMTGLRTAVASTRNGFA